VVVVVVAIAHLRDLVEMVELVVEVLEVMLVIAPLEQPTLVVEVVVLTKVQEVELPVALES
jgi:hypothetical protein